MVLIDIFHHINVYYNSLNEFAINWVRMINLKIYKLKSVQVWVIMMMLVSF